MKIIYTALVALALTFGATAFASSLNERICDKSFNESALEKKCMYPVTNNGITSSRCVPIKKPKGCSDQNWVYVKLCMKGTKACPAKCQDMSKQQCQSLKRCSYVSEGGSSSYCIKRSDV